ncbi:YbaB/EbfC family nucleoid-associated protein [Actinomadura hibisca]|uniref:YbaB/EbfC family nucleoid-associated protein n=1 Tax=Actinomadura hibisca TaxID=68565 RepID=UPI0012F957FE|nr:YbaB/EbfC family nucleoid-associated protein [Actinomadura hibisca]
MNAGKRNVAQARSEALMASLDEAEKRMDAIQQAGADYAKKLIKAEEVARNRHVEEKIKAGIGTVSVNGNGQIIEVRLNIDNLKHSDQSMLPGRLLDAVAKARQRARQLMREDLEKAASSLRI